MAKLTKRATPTPTPPHMPVSVSLIRKKIKFSDLDEKRPLLKHIGVDDGDK